MVLLRASGWEMPCQERWPTITTAAGVAVRVAVRIPVGGLVGGVVGVPVGVLVGVFVGVIVGVLEGVLVGVIVGVDVAQVLKLSVTSASSTHQPAEETELSSPWRKRKSRFWPA